MRPTVQGWLRDALAATRVTPAPLSAERAADAVALSAMHGDPFDRLIVATTVQLGAAAVKEHVLLPTKEPALPTASDAVAV